MSFLPKAAGTLAGGVIGGGMADKLLGTGKKTPD